MKSKNVILVVSLLLSLLSVQGFTALATSVNQMSLANIVGYPGKTTKVEITLEGTDPEEREGFWYAHYKKVEGDDERMDITSWITIEPKDFTIKQKEKKVFTIEIKIPRDAELGLWGATSEEAGKEGHSTERRTYIVFKDAPSGGNVYSGLLIPVSVKVLQSKSFLEPVINFILNNIITIVLAIIIVVLLVVPMFRRKKLLGGR